MLLEKEDALDQCEPMIKKTLDKVPDGKINKPKSDVKQLRLAEALRANLRRRKQQENVRKESER